MNNLQLKCKDLIEYLGDSIDDDSIEHIKNVFSNIEKEKSQSESIYPVYKRAGECEIPEGGLSKLDYFAAKIIGGIMSDPDVIGEPSVLSAAAYDMAEAMVKESKKRQS